MPCPVARIGLLRLEEHGDGEEDVVTDQMTVGVVDRLEVVKVAEDDDEGTSAPGRDVAGVLGPLDRGDLPGELVEEGTIGA